MKYFRLLLFAAFMLVVFIVPMKASAQNLQDFKFDSFDADYYLSRDSEGASVLKVQETLTPVFPEYDQNHGIARAIPKEYDGHNLRIENLLVTDENNIPLQHTTESENDNLVIKIQNPDVYVHGRKVYKISYTLHDVVKFFPDHDELFWDVNGDQWSQVFSTVSARFHISNELKDSIQDRQVCYTGSYGSTNHSCNITLVSPPDGSYVTASADNIQQNQTLSAVLGFNKGTFNYSTSVKNEIQREQMEELAAWVLAIVTPISAGVFMFRRWRKFGNDPKGRGIIVPEYEPPKGFDTLDVDYLMKQKLRNNAISATIIDMAVNGYVTIIEISKKRLFGKSKDYELRLKSVPGDNVSQSVHKALNIIFGESLSEGASVKLSDFESRPTQIYKKMQSLESALASDLTDRGYFIKNPKKINKTYQKITGVVFVGFFVVLWLAASTQFIPLFGLATGVMFATIIVFGFSFIMTARTEQGVVAYDSLLGLRDYIKLAEADRLKFLQSPEGAEKIDDKEAFDPKTPQAKVKLFEKLLPYAILFGLEKDWAKQFNDFYTSPPDWYQGGNWSTFNAAYLAGSLSSFNSATGSSFASPSSSSSSGFSGGGAGGGGGGGGGGGI